MAKVINVTDQWHAVSGSVSAVSVFTGSGVFMRLVVDKSVDASEFTFTDNDGAALVFNPDTDAKGTLNYLAKLNNGLKVTSVDFTGGKGIIFFKENVEHE
jgi:hypothetical protein